jgi:hypothetical protein
VEQWGWGALSLIRGFVGSPSPCLSCGLQRMAAFEYLNSNYGANLGGLRDENEKFREHSKVHFAVPETITLS